MSHKRIVWTLLIAAMLVISATLAQAQSSERPGEEAQETQAAAQGGFLDTLAGILARQKTAIVGAWLVTTATGGKVLHSFYADGTFIGSVQGEISTSSPLGSHTLQHGVWRHLDGRQFGVTYTDIFYDINTGQLKGFGKIRGLLTLADDGDEMSSQVKVQISDSNGNVLIDRAGSASYKRIKFELLD